MSKKSKKPTIPTNIVIEQWPVDKPVDHPKNARVITDKAVKIVASSIKEYGFNQPIIVDKDGVIIAGHTRRRAARLLGMETVPVTVATHLSAEQVAAYRLMDNRSAQETTWDMDVLAEVLSEMSSSMDVSLISEMTGFSEKEVEVHIGELATVPPIDTGGDEPPRSKKKKATGEKHTCPRCGFSYSESEEGSDKEPEEDEDEEAEEKPAPVKKTKGKKAPITAPEEEDEDEEPPKPAPKVKRRFGAVPEDD